jgi:hypothetical protein
VPEGNVRDPLARFARRLHCTSGQLWTLLIVTVVAVVLLFAVLPAALHPRADPPPPPDPFTGLITSRQAPAELRR